MASESTQTDAAVFALVTAARSARDQLWHLAKDPRSNPWVRELNEALAPFAPLTDSSKETTDAG